MIRKNILHGKVEIPEENFFKAEKDLTLSMYDDVITYIYQCFINSTTMPKTLHPYFCPQSQKYVNFRRKFQYELAPYHGDLRTIT